MQTVVDRLLKGETVTFRPSGNSMSPLIHPGDQVTVKPVIRMREGGLHYPTPLAKSKEGEKVNFLEVGDIVICMVKGRLLLHKITDITSDYRYQIGNNKGYINGYASAIYGVKI